MIDLDALERMAVELPAGAIGYVPIGPKLFAVLITELRACRKVVRAARECVNGLFAEAGFSNHEADAYGVSDLQVALEELEALKG